MAGAPWDWRPSDWDEPVSDGDLVVDDPGANLFRSVDSIQGDLTNPEYLAEHDPAGFYGFETPTTPAQELQGDPLNEPPPAEEPAFGPLVADAPQMGEEQAPFDVEGFRNAYSPEERAQLVAAGKVPQEALAGDDPFVTEFSGNLQKTPQELAAQGVRLESERQQKAGAALAAEEAYQQNELATLKKKYDDEGQEIQVQLAEANQEAKSLAEAKIDPEHWWSTRSTGQKVAAFISVALGGLLAPNNGGRNSALELIMKAIDQDMGAQKDSLVNRSYALGHRRGLLTDLQNRHKDNFRAQYTFVQASLEQAKAAIAQQAQLYNPAGITAQKAAELYNNVDAAQRKMAQDYLFKKEESRRKNYEADTHRLSARASQTSAAAAYKNAKTNEKELDLKREMDSAKLLNDVFKGSLETQKTISDIEANRAKLSTLNTGLVIGDPVTGKSLFKLRPGRPEKYTEELQTKVAYNTALHKELQDYNRELTRLGRTVNWNIDNLKDTDRQNLEARANKVMAGYLLATTGKAANEGEVARARTTIPGPWDLTQRSDPRERISQFSADIDNELRTEMLGAAAEGSKGAIDNFFQERRTYDAAIGKPEGMNHVEALYKDAVKPNDAPMEFETYKGTGQPLSEYSQQGSQIQSLVEMAAGGDERAQKAINNLRSEGGDHNAMVEYEYERRGLPRHWKK